MCFKLVSLVEHSFNDYEHLLKKRTQLLKVDDESSANKVLQAIVNNEDDEEDFDIETLLEKKNLRNSNAKLQQESENQNLEIVIQTFENRGTGRTIQEYCKPVTMEALTLDYDDVCQLAVTVVKFLIGDRIDDFQLKIMETISDIQATI